MTFASIETSPFRTCFERYVVLFSGVSLIQGSANKNSHSKYGFLCGK